MHKIRVLSSIIGLSLLIAVVLLGEAALGVVVFLIALIGIHEFYQSLEHAGYKPVKIAGYISCLPVLLIGLKGRIAAIDSYFDLFKSVNYFMN